MQAKHCKFQYAFILISLLIGFGCEPTSKNKVEQQQINSVQAELFYESSAELGEGALWDVQTNSLYWVDILGKTFNILNVEAKDNSSFSMPSAIGTVISASDSTVMVALVDGVYQYNFLEQELQPFALPDLTGKDVRFNDGKCDPSGRFWVGTMHNPQNKDDGSVYMFETDGTITEQIKGVTISNGIVWNKASTMMFYIDTPTQQVVSYEFDNATGQISNRRIVAEIPKEMGFPDGMTIDENDHLWVALWNGNAVINIDHKTGEILNTVVVPAHNVTNCAFGGPNLDELYITTASVDMMDQEQKDFPHAGSIFLVKPGVRGIPSVRFGDQP